MFVFFDIDQFSTALHSNYPWGRCLRDVGTEGMGHLAEADYDTVAERLAEANRLLRTSAVIAPAVVYEAGQRDIQRLNRRLFDAAHRAAAQLKLPVYSTVVLGHSVMSSEETLSAALASATSHTCDGFFLACEFQEDRIPASRALVERFLNATLTIAAAGKPVMHGYAGPMALLSFGVGAQAAAVGHRHNLWQFSRNRWGPTPTQGGGPQTYPPRRFFSSALWGTIIYPDETAQLPVELAQRVLTHTPFSDPVSSGAEWKPGDSWRHLVYAIGQGATAAASSGTARDCAAAAVSVLDDAIHLHSEVRAHVSLRDETDSYQAAWRDALQAVAADRNADYEFLEMLS